MVRMGVSKVGLEKGLRREVCALPKQLKNREEILNWARVNLHHCHVSNRVQPVCRMFDKVVPDCICLLFPLHFRLSLDPCSLGKGMQNTIVSIRNGSLEVEASLPVFTMYKL